MVIRMKKSAINFVVGLTLGAAVTGGYSVATKHTVEQVADTKPIRPEPTIAPEPIVTKIAENADRKLVEDPEQSDVVEKPKIYRSKKVISLSKPEFECLARNIYYEAGVEDVEGKLAVAQVTINRWRSKEWGKTVCQAVYYPNQFSWTSDRSKRWVRPHGPLWNESVKVARQFSQQGLRVKGVEDSHHYHADYIKTPKWALSMAVAEQIGQHVFYH